MHKVVIIFTFLRIVQCYNVALVEYFFDQNAFLQLLPVEAANRNAKMYMEVVEKIKKDNQNLDLVVFPEGTLVSEPLDTPDGRQAMTFIPTSEDNIIPCNSSDKEYADFFRSLSCTAKKYNTYMVINLKEKEDKNGKMKFYNADVVFDRDGRVIARYRKNHIYLEKDTNRPDIPELITFKTDFGKTFGIFTCFDILFESPAMELVRQGVENFIFPTLWIPELPFLTTNQVQQMWAQGNDVTLLASGAALPDYGSGGLGIYLGNKITLAKVVTPKNETSFIYKNVPNTNGNVDSKCSIQINDNIAKEMDKYPLHTENLSKYSYERMDFENLKYINKTLCQDGFCCDFDIEIERIEVDYKMPKKVYEYFMVIRNGIRTFGNKTYTGASEICGLVACRGPTLKQCGRRFPNYEEISWPIVFKKISIKAVFEKLGKNMQFPNSLMADFSPISPTCTTWISKPDNIKSTVERTFSTKTPLSKILTFAIFGKNYAKEELLSSG